MIWFVTTHQHTNASHKCINTKSYLEFPNRSRTKNKTYFLLDYDPATIHLPSFSSSNWPNSRPYLFAMPCRWTRPYSLALRVTCRCRQNAKSVWVPQRVLRVTCHSTWGCGGVCKKDHGQPWRLTSFDLTK